MDNDDNMGDFWRDVKAASQVKRANNRQSSPDLLRAAGVPFTTKNGDAHLIVKTDGGHTVDFWPGTGLWIMRGATQRHGGVRKLIAFCKPGRAPRALTVPMSGFDRPALAATKRTGRPPGKVRLDWRVRRHCTPQEQ